MKLLPTDYAVRNLGRSSIRMVATVGGSAIVVLLVVSAAAFVNGMRRSLAPAPSNRNILFVSTGSEESLERSQISAAIPGHVAAGVRGIRSELGIEFVSPEINFATVVHESSNSTEHELRAVFRGVTPTAYLVHPQVEIIDGRAPRVGREEIMAGTLAARKLGLPEERLAVGQTIWFDDREWEIVGRFRAPATVMQSEIWIPLTDLQVATKNDGLSTVVITLDGETEPEDVAVWAATRIDLEVTALAESEYYASLQRFFRPVRMMIWTTALLMALAGLLGGVNTLYAAFAARTREVGMLQSLGFQRRAIFVSFLQESLIVSSAGALLACLVAWILVDGAAVQFSMGVFELSVDAPAIAAGLVAGLLVGIVGSLPPAIHCLRLPIPSALKAT